MSNQIIGKAKSLGASLAGIADARLLKQSPSHIIYPKMEHNLAVGSRETAEGIELGQVAWPANAKAVVVIAVEHNKDEPQMDWWLSLIHISEHTRHLTQSRFPSY